MITPLLLIVIPPLTRWHRGLHLLGDTGLETLVGTAVLVGCFFGSIPVFVFGLISAHDFNRRARLISSLGSLVKYPGIPLSELLGNTNEQTPKTADQGHLFIDLDDANNVFAWMNCRKTLRSFGEGYYQRTQVYTSILLGYAFLCVFALNIIMWGQLQHHVSTVYLISFLVFAIASIAIASINKATRLQGLSRIHRDMIKQEVFLQEKQLLELDPASQHVQILRLRQAKTLLQQVDEMIHFQEEIYKPTRVLGQAATQNVLNSTFGLLLAGVIFAVEGSGGARIVYDTFGWFMK
jgi:multisubunit Na+/H+ antiporter MnhG subunit